MSRLKVTPSMGVAVVALVLAASGGAYATTHGATRSLTACVHHVGGGLYVVHRRCARGDRSLRLGIAGPRGIRGTKGVTGARGPTGAPGSAGGVGGPGLAGASATKLFAQIKDNGTVNTSSPSTVTATYESGNFFVNFGQDITHCVPIVQEGSLPVFGGSAGDA